MRPFDRIGVRFVAAMLAVLGVAVLMIAIAAQSMFINDQDQRLLMWVLVPAVLGAALVAMLMARPVARDASKICDAAMRVADGDLGARTGVIRSDELGEAAAMFDKMVDRLDAIEQERAMMLSSISHDLRTPLAALRAAVEAIRDGVAPDPDMYLIGMERQVRALSSLVDDLQLHSRIVSGTFQLNRTRLDLTELADEAMETLRPLAEQRQVKLLLGKRTCCQQNLTNSHGLFRQILNQFEIAFYAGPWRQYRDITVVLNELKDLFNIIFCRISGK